MPVYASAITHELMAAFPLADRAVLEPGRPITAGPFRLTSFPVVHSIRCPCIAARIETPEGVVVYSGDVISFEAAEEALADVRLYIGDGSTLDGLPRAATSGRSARRSHDRSRAARLAGESGGAPRDLFPLRRGSHRNGRSRARERSEGTRRREGPGLPGLGGEGRKGFRDRLEAYCFEAPAGAFPAVPVFA